MAIFPVYKDGSLEDGVLVELSSFCEAKFKASGACREHYELLRSKSPGWYQCPFGLSCRSYFESGSFAVFTGMVAHPRFDTANERELAKKYPRVRIGREAVNEVVRFIESIESSKADAVLESSKVLPQAFHELRKLNGVVLQTTEREITEKGSSKYLQTVKSASELMKNNFDILEALANIEAMQALPLDSTVNLFDLSYKVKRVYDERASQREMSISVDGVRAIVNGSQKSFPVVPAVLIENAIKYGVRGTHIHVEVIDCEDEAILTVRNTTKESIDPIRCFDRGTRYSGIAEGGGFGLYLANQITISHGGSIVCEPGDQTVTMRVTLPLKTIATPFKK